MVQPPHKRKSLFKRVINHGILSAQIEEIIKILIPSGIVGISLTNKISKYHIKIITKKSFEESKLQDADLHLIRTAVAQKLNLPYETLTVVIHQIADNSLNATAMCEKIKDMMMKGAKAQSAARSTLRLIMKSQPIGAEIKISGKIRGQRARTQKYRAGTMIHTGDFVSDIVVKDVTHAFFSSGVIGIKVKIHLDPAKVGLANPVKIPDLIELKKTKSEFDATQPPNYQTFSECFPQDLANFLMKKLKAEELQASGAMQPQAAMWFGEI